MLEYQVSSDAWTLIGDNVTNITYQNVGQNYIYINFTAANTAPVESIGLLYPPLSGEIKKIVADLTTTANAAYVWARSASKTSKIISESS